MVWTIRSMTPNAVVTTVTSGSASPPSSIGIATVVGLRPALDAKANLKGYTFGAYENAAVSWSIANGAGGNRPQVLGLSNDNILATYADRDSVAFYAANTVPAPTQTTAAVSFTATTVGLASAAVTGVVVGMVVDTNHSPKFSGRITDISGDRLTLTVSGWFQMGNSVAGQVPTGTPTLYINPTTKAWAHNANIFLESTSHGSRGAGFELGVFNNRGNLTYGDGGSGATGGSNLLWGYDAVSLGTYQGGVGYMQRGNFLRGYVSKGAQQYGFAIEDTSQNPAAGFVSEAITKLWSYRPAGVESSHLGTDGSLYIGKATENGLGLAPTVSGQPAAIVARGPDANIDVAVVPKGAGKFKLPIGALDPIGLPVLLRQIAALDVAANEGATLQVVGGVLTLVGGSGGAPVSPPVFSVAPAITGTPTEGQALSATTGTASNSPTYALQWKRNGSAISGATGSTYLLVTADVGTVITVTSTATNAGGSVTSTSAATATIAAATVVAPTFPTTVNASLPVFAITPETTTNPTTFTLLDLESVIAGDSMWIEAATDDGFTANVTRHYHTVTDAELAAGAPFNFTFTPALSTLTGGTRRYRPALQRGTERSAYGTAQRVGPNDVAPSLSALSVSNITFTTANINVTTNYPLGTLYFLHTATNVAPTTAAMVAGVSQAVTTAGAKVQQVTGTSGELRYGWVMHRPEAGPDSAITAAGAIQFVAPVASSAWDPVSINFPGHAPLVVSNDNRTITQQSASGPIRFQGAQARTSGKLWIEYETFCNSSGEVNPGLLDSTTNVIMTFNPNSDDAGPGGPWNLTYNKTAVHKIRFEVNFDADTVQAFVDGTSAGTHAFPANFGASLRGWTEIGGAVGVYNTINTGQATPVGTVTSGFSAWG